MDITIIIITTEKNTKKVPPCLVRSDSGVRHSLSTLYLDQQTAKEPENYHIIHLATVHPPYHIKPRHATAHHNASQ